MPHYCFKQPNGKYTVWSTIVDTPISWNASKEEIWFDEQVIDEIQWKHWCKENLEDVLDKGLIDCCLYNGNMTKEELLDYFKEIEYFGNLYTYAKDWKIEDMEEYD